MTLYGMCREVGYCDPELCGLCSYISGGHPYPKMFYHLPPKPRKPRKPYRRKIDLEQIDGNVGAYPSSIHRPVPIEPECLCRTKKRGGHYWYCPKYKSKVTA